MKNILKQNKNFIGYFIAAASGVLVQYLVGTIFLINTLNWQSKPAFAVGFIVSFPVGFVLTKLLAFDAKNSGKTQREFVKYLLTVVASGFITVYGADFSVKLLEKLFGDFTINNPLNNTPIKPAAHIGHFMGMGASFIFNFVAHKYFTFRQTGIWDKLKTKLNIF